MSFKLVSTSPSFGYYAMEPIEYLKQHGCEVELVPQGKKMSEDDLVACAAEVDAMVVGIEKITARVIQAGKKLKVIAKHGAGVDNIDMETATKNKIVVTSAPGANSDAVADMTMGLFLALARSLPFADRSVKGGGWPRMAGTQLNKKTLGIIGVGQIGKKVARRAAGFDMKILVYDVVKDEEFAATHGVTYLPLDNVIQSSDFISIHVPLTSTTRNLISTREFGMMKKGAFLVNIARGGIVDETALFPALKEKKISGAALDVFAQEPPTGSPLLSLDNFIATPHMGGYTMEALNETGMICVRNIMDVLAGKKPQFLNNPEVFK